MAPPTTVSAACHDAASAAEYRRRRPETTALYELVRDNLETLYGAITDGALEVRLPKHAKKELEAYLDVPVLLAGQGRARRRAALRPHAHLR